MSSANLFFGIAAIGLVVFAAFYFQQKKQDSSAAQDFLKKAQAQSQDQNQEQDVEVIEVRSVELTKSNTFKKLRSISPENVMAHKADQIFEKMSARELSPLEVEQRDQRLIRFLEHDRENPHLQRFLNQMTPSARSKLRDLWKEQDEKPETAS